MTDVILTQERLKELMHYDSKTGIFTRLKVEVKNQTKVGDILGSRVSKGYLAIRIDTKLYKSHRLAFLYMTGKWPVNQVDHINQIKDDNSWANLREANTIQNKQNANKPNADNTSGYRGVCWHTRDQIWEASIRINGKPKYLGRYATAEAGHIAYLEAKKKYHEYSTI